MFSFFCFWFKTSLFSFIEDGIDKRRVSVEAILPVGKILLEGSQWNAPADPLRLLTFIYGNVEPHAKYNPDTGLYE